MADKLHAFYCSKVWRELAFMLKLKRGGKCERCGEILTDFSRLIGHHRIELTESNLDNVDISLNPKRIEIVCTDCHNAEHRRFGYEKRVYIVWGSPLSGKTTAVRQMIRRGDIVMDIDILWQAVSLQPVGLKPENLRYNVFALRDLMLDQIRTRYGQWCDAYIIGGYPDKYERERTAQRLGAELIYCESTMDECVQRLKDSGKPEVWSRYITDWWETYERTGT